MHRHEEKMKAQQTEPDQRDLEASSARSKVKEAPSESHSSPSPLRAVCPSPACNPAEVPALHHHGHLQRRALLAAAAAAGQDPAAAAPRHRAQQRQPACGQGRRAGGGQAGLSPEHEEKHRYQRPLNSVTDVSSFLSLLHTCSLSLVC